MRLPKLKRKVFIFYMAITKIWKPFGGDNFLIFVAIELLQSTSFFFNWGHSWSRYLSRASIWVKKLLPKLWYTHFNVFLEINQYAWNRIPWQKWKALDLLQAKERKKNSEQFSTFNLKKVSICIEVNRFTAILLFFFFILSSFRLLALNLLLLYEKYIKTLKSAIFHFNTNILCNKNFYAIRLWVTLVLLNVEMWEVI